MNTSENRKAKAGNIRYSGDLELRLAFADGNPLQRPSNSFRNLDRDFCAIIAKQRSIQQVPTATQVVLPSPPPIPVTFVQSKRTSMEKLRDIGIIDTPQLTCESTVPFHGFRNCVLLTVIIITSSILGCATMFSAKRGFQLDSNTQQNNSSITFFLLVDMLTLLYSLCLAVIYARMNNQPSSPSFNNSNQKRMITLDLMMNSVLAFLFGVSIIDVSARSNRCFSQGCGLAFASIAFGSISFLSLVSLSVLKFRDARKRMQ